MKILPPNAIKAVDAYAIKNCPITLDELIEKAALACTNWIIKHFDRNRKVVILAGTGNNGADGLAIAQQLTALHYEVEIIRLTKDLQSIQLPALTAAHLVIDAMFGIGLSRPAEGVAQMAAHIRQSGATVVSIDIPSGLFAEDNTGNSAEYIINADYTLTFQQAKLSFFFAENAPFVGKWEVLDIGLPTDRTEEEQAVKNYMLQQTDVVPWFLPRQKFSHKGTYGHACVIAGSHNMMGAALLAVKACLRSGAGLVTAHIPHGENPLMQLYVPEALISADTHPEVWSQLPDLKAFSAIAIGSGIGKQENTRQALIKFLKAIRVGNIQSPPLVLDADALNIIAESEEGTDLLPANCIITPHPKEFDRLTGNSTNGYQRWKKQLEIAQKQRIYVVLKGANTCIASPDGSCYFNTTGNPGMATAGSGDVLTGVIVSLLAQGWEPIKAACAGVWLHGAAGDLAAKKHGQQGMIASDIVDFLGKALKSHAKYLQKYNI
ncbi:MAG: NAD(P)H-hydrate dehydratase [Bacteroidales bacterium]|jgi:NAD(P)H-hydrate epimerase|nr:NAD(P)H-hydrate dehydratase [Bacteroidales bacterium]